jgi:hypothetical protein
MKQSTEEGVLLQLKFARAEIDYIWRAIETGVPLSTFKFRAHADFAIGSLINVNDLFELEEEESGRK